MNRTQEDRKKSLIRLLIDQHALDADRDDAAMDLGEEFDDESVLSALIQVANNPNEIDMILNSCGEAIGKIWVKRSYFDEKIYRKLPKFAQDGIYCVIKNRQPEWIEGFHIDSI